MEGAAQKTRRCAGEECVRSYFHNIASRTTKAKNKARAAISSFVGRVMVILPIRHTFTEIISDSETNLRRIRTPLSFLLPTFRLAPRSCFCASEKQIYGGQNLVLGQG